MGCAQSTVKERALRGSSFAPKSRLKGTTVVEVIKAGHLPCMDFVGLTDAYVEMSVIDEYGIPASTEKTLCCHKNLNPIFHGFLAIPYLLSDSDNLFFRVWDHDDVSADEKIGTADIIYSELKHRMGEEITIELNMEARHRSKDGSNPSVTFRLVSATPGDREAVEKEIFIIRHGQSKWNEGQSKGNVKELVGQVDHELTKLGIEQAQNFNSRWKEAKKNGGGEEDIEHFLSCQKIFSSPLTRAAQTALLTCEDHPMILQDGLTLLRNLREVKNFGSFDTVGKYSGNAIKTNVKEKIDKELGTRAANKLTAPTMNIHDAEGHWWTSLEKKEDAKDILERQKDLFAFLRYGVSADKIILVGHSHFFRDLVCKNFSDAYRAAEPEWTSSLERRKLGNSACMKISVKWESPNPMARPQISNAKLVFGSSLAPETSSRSVHAPSS